jgi:hypothetical protein
VDPDTTLEVIRQAIRYDGPLSDAERLVILTENVHALDEWLKRGGFLPREWRGARDA